MRWIRDSQRDSREDIRAAQQALVYAGYPHADAVTEVTAHLRRVRAALAAPSHALVAGFLTGASMAVGVFAVLTLALGVLGLVIGAVGESGTPAEFAPAVQPAPPADASPGSPLGVLPAVAVAAPVLGLAGAGMSRVTRNRWRRAGVLRTFTDLAPGRRYLLETVAVWLAVAGVIVLIVWVLAGPQLGANVAQGLAFFGIPLGAAAFAAWFANLYAWILPRVSPVDAAAYARPIIEREAARQIKAEREFYGRGAYDRINYDRNRWADEVLATEATEYFADVRRREATAPLPSSYERRHRLAGTRLGRYMVLTGAITIGGWRLAHWIDWIGHPSVDAGSHAAGPHVDVLGLVLGLILGVVVTWIYAQNFENL